jgi:hypothetical protein
MTKEPIISGRGPLPPIARTIFAKALADCSIDRAFAQRMSIETAADGTARLVLGDSVVDLAGVAQVRVIAIGKAARTLLEAMLPRLPLPASCDVQGVLIAPAPPAQLPRGFRFFAGAILFPMRRRSRAHARS